MPHNSLITFNYIPHTQITAYNKVPQVKGLRPCMLPLGAIIAQQEFNARVASIDAAAGGTGTSGVPMETPSKDKKKKRKTEEVDAEGDELVPPSTGKAKKDKKSKKK